MSPTTHQGAEGAETKTAGQSLDLRDLHAANIARQAEWCPDQVPDLSFRGNELGGECGEAQNVIKKLERERQGWRGSRATKDDLADELADVVICADLCAVTADIDLGAAVRRKFNATSEKQGLSVFLPIDPAALATPRTDSAERTAGEEPWTLSRAFDLGFWWGVGLYTSPQSMEDSRAVGRTLLDPEFDGLGIDLDGWDSFQSGDLGMCEGKRRIKEALDRIATPAPSSPGVPDSVRALSEAATKGEWYTESEKCDGSYGSGEDCGEGYLAYSILTDAERPHGTPGVIAETSNSTLGVIHEESDEDGFTAWDETARANTAFIVAAVNYVRTLLSDHPAGQSTGQGADSDSAALAEAASVPERAYGILWRLTAFDAGQIGYAHDARKVLLAAMDKEGQRRGIAWATRQYGPLGPNPRFMLSDKDRMEMGL